MWLERSPITLTFITIVKQYYETEIGADRIKLQELIIQITLTNDLV